MPAARAQDGGANADSILETLKIQELGYSRSPLGLTVWMDLSAHVQGTKSLSNRDFSTSSPPTKDATRALTQHTFGFTKKNVSLHKILNAHTRATADYYGARWLWNNLLIFSQILCENAI